MLTMPTLVSRAGVPDATMVIIALRVVAIIGKIAEISRTRVVQEIRVPINLGIATANGMAIPKTIILRIGRVTDRRIIILGYPLPVVESTREYLVMIGTEEIPVITTEDNPRTKIVPIMEQMAQAVLDLIIEIINPMLAHKETKDLTPDPGIPKAKVVLATSTKIPVSVPNLRIGTKTEIMEIGKD